MTANEAIFQLVFERSPAGSIVVDANGLIVLASRQVERLFGYPREELIGRPVELLVPEAVAGDHERLRGEYLTQARERPMGEGRRLFGRCKDGEEVPVEIGLNPIQTDAGLFVVGSVVDIRPRLEAERRLRESERLLEHAQKLDALGTLAGGIAHDFNNVLLGIIGYADLLASAVADDSQAAADLAALKEAARRGKDLVGRILTFARHGTDETSELQLEPTLMEAIKLLRATLPTTIQLTTTFDLGTPSVRGNATELHQIMMNLGSNAAAALGGQGGKLSVSVAPWVLTADATGVPPGAAPGLYARLVVTDTGAGMSPEVQARAFEPFFTTKEPGQGTGLGLAVIHGIAKKRGGFITIESTEGLGTTVSVHLPAAHAEPAGPARRTATGGVRRLALWVDDEPNLAALGRRQLESWGLAVDSHTSSLQALEAFRRRPEAYCLVVSDNTMPHLTGLEFIREVTRIRPDVPTLMVTGNGGSVSPATLELNGVKRVLPKPFDAGELHAVVSDLIGPGILTSRR